MLTENIDLPTVDLCFQILTDLLKYKNLKVVFILHWILKKKKFRKYDKISRLELVIEWRPIYDLYIRIHKINDISSVLAPENVSFKN